MAYKGKVITNPVTGQQIKFVQTAKDTSGQLLEMESEYAPASKEPPPHYHPYQAEDFTILDGEMTVRMQGGLTVLKKVTACMCRPIRYTLCGTILHR